MDGFADGARHELLATGEAGQRTLERRADLTTQEAHIAHLAGGGWTNGEIATQMFISARTVEWHLRKVLPKLAIRSRRELPGAAGRPRPGGAPHLVPRQAIFGVAARSPATPNSRS